MCCNDFGTFRNFMNGNWYDEEWEWILLEVNFVLSWLIVYANF